VGSRVGIAAIGGLVIGYCHSTVDNWGAFLKMSVFNKNGENCALENVPVTHESRSCGILERSYFRHFSTVDFFDSH
jgi:hypothetical protein